MKVVALEAGFHGGMPIAVGQEFDVPEGAKSRWYAPVAVAQKAAETKGKEAKAKAPASLSDTGKQAAQSFNDSMA